jgi:hypothetical protein
VFCESSDKVRLDQPFSKPRTQALHGLRQFLLCVRSLLIYHVPCKAEETLVGCGGCRCSQQGEGEVLENWIVRLVQDPLVEGILMLRRLWSAFIALEFIVYLLLW